MKLTLKSKILFPIIVLIVAGTFVSVMLAYNTSKKIIVKMAKEHLVHSVNFSAVRLNDWIKNEITELDQLTKYKNIREAAKYWGLREDAGINKLGNSAKEIGKIVNLIQGIASQTNLLSLNAAIEAAGAGEAGRGFAVVANEVKELARQTSGATHTISETIETMQENTRSAVDAIVQIVQVINEINQIMGTIAAAVEEQTTTTNEISNSIASTAENSTAVSANAEDVVKTMTQVTSTMEELSKATEIIAQDVSEASAGTESVLNNFKKFNILLGKSSGVITEIHSESDELSVLSGTLKENVLKFKL